MARFIVFLIPMLAGCQREAYVDVWLDEPEEASLAGATDLRLWIGSSALDAQPADFRVADLVWPTRARLKPRGSESGRSFWLDAELLDGDRSIQRVHTHGTYLDFEQHEIRLRFEQACIGVVCGASETCRAGICEDGCAPFSACGASDGGTSMTDARRDRPRFGRTITPAREARAAFPRREAARCPRGEGHDR